MISESAGLSPPPSVRSEFLQEAVSRGLNKSLKCFLEAVLLESRIKKKSETG